MAPLASVLEQARDAYLRGDLRTAELVLGQLLRQRPDNAAAWTLRGQVARKGGRLEEAEQCFAKAAMLVPDNAGATLQHGTILHSLGRTVQAAACYRRALALKPDWPKALVRLATALRDIGEPEAAAMQARRALETRPGFVDAEHCLVHALCDLGRYEEAARLLGRAFMTRPDDIETLHNLGVALQGAGFIVEAEQCLRRAVALAPERPEPLRNLGNLLRAEGRLDDAVRCYEDAVRCRPGDVRSYANLALALMNLNRPHEAIALYEKALGVAPDHPEIRMSLGIAQLLIGDYSAGWANYEHRRRTRAFAGRKRDFGAPEWRGEALADSAGRPRRLLIYAEQGFGDTLQFCRYLPVVASRGGGIVFECPQPLAPLMTSLEGASGAGAISVIPCGAPLPPVDFQIPLLSLPHLMGTTESSIPAAAYLAAPEEKIVRWRKRMDRNRLNVGITWAGNPDRRDDRMRSCPLAALASIFAVEGVRFFALQKQAPPLNRSDVEELGPDLIDFSDTAAAVSALDLVISVDTAVAHLAGALGRPVWVMLGYAADWRYLLDREDCPWYPTMRLLRQSKPEDWEGLTARLAQALRELATARR